MAADIAPELYEKIKEVFESKYEQAKLFGNPISDTLTALENGTATFRDADLYAGEVGSLLSEALKECISLDDMPGGKFYYNIATRTVGQALQDEYRLASNVAGLVQEAMNEAQGIGLKVVRPEPDQHRVRNVVDRAARAETQEQLESALTEPVKTEVRRASDDTQKANARLHNSAGLEVKVEREYDGVGLSGGRECSWCQDRAGTFTYSEAMANGVFERHEGCGCIITYTSAKGKSTRSYGKYSGWTERSERLKREEEIVAKKYPDISPQAREVRAKYQLAVSTGGKYKDSEKIELGWVGTKDIDATIEHFKNEFRNQSLEHALVIDTKGNVTMFIGSETNVTLQDVKLDGAHILHNHPPEVGNKSFGEDDFYLIRNTQNGIFDLVDKDYDYHLEVLKSFENISYNDIYRSVAGNVFEIKDEDYQHLVMEELKNRGYVFYERKKANT